MKTAMSAVGGLIRFQVASAITLGMYAIPVAYGTATPVGIICALREVDCFPARQSTVGCVTNP